jgi:subtilisin family serine protease
VIPISMGSLGSPLLFAEAIENVVNVGADVVVGSVHSLNETPVMSSLSLPAVCEHAEARGTVIVWSALEDDAPRSQHWIGQISTVLLVAAVNNLLERQPGTRDVDVVAPGAGVPAATLGGGFDEFVGHSFAAPIAAAVAAHARLLHPNLTANQLRRHVAAKSCAVPCHSADPAYGAGVVNVRRVRAQGKTPACPPQQRL